MLRIKKITLIILIIYMGVFGASCSKGEDISAVQEVDLSDEAQTVEAFGVIRVDESKDVIIDFPAIVQEVIAKEGQHLGLYDPILTLDLSDYENLLQDKRNELNIARLEYQRADASLKGLSIENIDIQLNKLESDLELAKKSYEQTLEEHNSIEKLYEMGAVSKENLQQSKLGLDEALNKVEAIEYERQLVTSRYERELDQLSTRQDTERYQVSIQNERIQQIENNLATLEDKVNKPYFLDSQIVSEFENAAIYDIAYSSGSMTDATQKAFTIVNLDSLIVEADVVEEFISDVKVGASVRIVPIADRTREYTGSVIYISKMAFTKNGETEVPIRISIDNMDSFLLPNYNVDIYIDVK
ncbi:efflux RND transporter periplasmic adaptor subunit [Tissierella sp. Yu-01]|uniref:HlyD family secretion protein n=1 Tax=Tissierella sp. Yu-01 TaxID=3035694 RepID=UPI00240E5B5B|nr:efflux RND transporter periplasmic adaptor subunit [Tissierella sp. Yu-01]WFA08639.1 efflux RND transporter periplasmic adaptor subunit [Tissierella sp. Yu-01]